MDIGCLAGCVELKLDAIVLGQTKNLVMHGEVVSVHEHMWNGQVQAAAHAAELEGSWQDVIFHSGAITSGDSNKYNAQPVVMTRAN
jgi:hypothetical protein